MSIEEYIFMECCGCGSTRVFLEINEHKFIIRYYSYWMGCMGPVWFKFEGLMDDTATGYITTSKCMIEPRYIGTKQLCIGDTYEISPKTIKVSFTRLAGKKLSDNTREPDWDDEKPSHLGNGFINAGNGVNYNCYYQMEMRFILPDTPLVTFDSHSEQVKEIDTMIHPDGQYLSKIVTQLRDINYVQMGLLDGDRYQEMDYKTGRVYMQFERNYLSPHENHNVCQHEGCYESVVGSYFCHAHTPRKRVKINFT